MKLSTTGYGKFCDSLALFHSKNSRLWKVAVFFLYKTIFWMIQIYMGKSLSFMQYADLEAVLEQIEIVRNSSYQRWLQSLLWHPNNNCHEQQENQ